MRYFKITFKEQGTTDSMDFAANDPNDAWRQLDELTGGVPREFCRLKEITEDDYLENHPPEEEASTSAYDIPGDEYGDAKGG